jgi:excisionase family DNA binding protein
MNSYMSAADASRVLDVTTATIRLMVRRGDLPVAATTEGGIRLFNRTDVEGLAARRQSQPRRSVAIGENNHA